MRPPPLNSHRQKVLLQPPPSLFALAENYPELEGRYKLQRTAEGTERYGKQDAFARQFYNDTVQKYNVRIEVFPANLIAGRFGFKPESFFSLDLNAEQRENVRVRFDGSSQS